MKFTSLLTACAISTVVFAQTVEDVKADVANIVDLVSRFDIAVRALPPTGSSLSQALAVHNAATVLTTGLDDATGDIQATPSIPESDMEDILPSLQQICTTIQYDLTRIVLCKPAFDNLPIGGISALVKQDISNLRTSFYAFLNALGIHASPPVKPQILQFRDQLDASFVAAQAAYS